METLDREYDDYRREHQERFESDFGTGASNVSRSGACLARCGSIWKSSAVTMSMSVPLTGPRATG